MNSIPVNTMNLMIMYLHNDKSSGLLNSIYRIARELTLINKRKLIRKITGLKSGKLLDIGSGSGHFLRKMKIAGWITAGWR
jgi:2-polyprenyl-3-methyl-5-hydroxy-6-metoxy-1,4-benzoquinol methylase